MADPFTLFAVASTAVSAGGAIAQGRAEYSQAMGESQVAAENARRAKMSAANIRLVGQVAEEAKRREIRRSLGRTAAAMSQNGTGGPSSSTNQLLMKQVSGEAEFDARSIRYDAQTDAYNTELQAANYEAESRAAKRRARGAKIGTFINVASAVLNGYSSYSGRRARLKAPSYGSTASTPGVGPVVYKGP